MFEFNSSMSPVDPSQDLIIGTVLILLVALEAHIEKTIKSEIEVKLLFFKVKYFFQSDICFLCESLGSPYRYQQLV